MKKILLSFVFFAVIMIGTVSTTHATETFYVKVTLSDTCSPTGYKGYYCVRLTLRYYGAPVCTATNCRILPGNDVCYAFTCSFAPVSSDPGYSVTFDGAARYPSGDCATTTGIDYGIDYWENLSTGCNVVSISVIL